MYINSVEHLKKYLRQAGYEIVDQNYNYGSTVRCLIAWHRKVDTMVYIDFKIFDSVATPRARNWWKNWIHRLRARRLFRIWLRENRWRGDRRFDIVNVFSTERTLGSPIVDHIVDVKM